MFCQSLCSSAKKAVLDARTAHADRTILIDCGKTFRESVFKWFPQRNITRIDALILTREFFSSSGRTGTGKLS